MWLNPQEIVKFVTFTAEIFHEKLHFLWNEGKENERKMLVK